MADFRKWLFALAVVALLAGFTVPASAQIPSTPVCSSQVATNNLARAEGYTEQVGDLIVTCTGGNPTAAGLPVPQADITVTLSQNVTSRITASTSGATFLEALLIIDEPNSPINPATQILNCGAPGALDQNVIGESGPGVCEIIAFGATNGNSSPFTYDGAPSGATANNCGVGGTPITGLCTGHPNVFQGRQGQTANVVVFHGVPLDPPGTTTRILRFTNIRVNANGAGIAQANQTSLITMSIASAGNSTLQISVQAQAVATVQKGLLSSTVFSNTTFAQCISQAKGLLTASPEPIFGTTSTCGSSSCNGSTTNNPFTTGFATPTIRFSEGFASSWKVKNVAYTLANGTYTGGLGGANPYIYSGAALNPAGVALPDVNQNVPGVSYFTESGFEFQSVAQNPNPDPPPGFLTSAIVTGNQNPFADAAGTGINAAGVANQGTRLATALSNIPNGLSLYVSPVIFLFRQGTSYTSGPNQNLPAGLATGVMVLTNTASDGSGTYNPPSGPITVASQPLQLVSVTNGAALVVYEILFTDPFSLEYADVPFVVSYSSALSSNAPIGLPQPNVVATYAAGFAPFYSTSAATLASGTLPIPRFVFTGAASNLFGIVKCSCNLLFPYVTQAPGYDTGIAIANTTMDPYGTTNQFGSVQMWYYGSLANGGAAPGTQCTNTASPGTCPGTTPVGAGQVLTYTLYNGSAQWGLDNRGAGFTGYMITQAQFQYCHAFAFIGGLGGGPMVNANTNGLSEGYLALVLDLAGLPRTGITGESLGQ
ncbi:MAG TPA: hypothetical protein VK752_11250 [Bryobacteraceae bacterium]|nr:hypothetical protein [Bryobacteraceae bacterium]